MSVEAQRKLNDLLLEAHSNEVALIGVLSAHSRMALEPAYRGLLEAHLEETRGHAMLVRERLEQKGAHRSPMQAAYGVVQNALKQGLTLAKAPVDVLRGGRDRVEKQLRNAMDEVMTEGLEIAAYDAIEATARAAGDEATAELAVRIRADEEQMLARLREQITALGAAYGGGGQKGPTGAPWPGYDEMSAEDVVERLREASPALKAQVHGYESQGKGRKTVLRAAE
ncbi:MAG TPA: DUF892 family protein [Actinomycetota bacterium]|jgi:ferritin-like metal-binding protein YciE|nr:DUF892 family protein [Actinomycetota bacterium]